MFIRPAKALELLKRTANAWIDHNAPGLGAAVAFYTILAFTPLFLIVLNFLISLGVVTLVFGLIFKVMPDAWIAWREVWIGALITGLMFNLGKFLLGLYLGRGSFASAYGAAGSLVIVLLWVYYSSQIVLAGAEFTRIYAEECGTRIQAKPGAHFVTVKEVEQKQTAARKT